MPKYWQCQLDESSNLSPIVHLCVIQKPELSVTQLGWVFHGTRSSGSRTTVSLTAESWSFLLKFCVCCNVHELTLSQMDEKFPDGSKAVGGGGLEGVMVHRWALG